MTVAPNPMFPEKGVNVFESSFAPSIPMNKGPLRFEEGVATDTDVPHDFAQGAYMDTQPYGRSNHNNPEAFYKHAMDTMRERAHVGSASWTEAPTFLGEFAHGTMNDYSAAQIETVARSGGRTQRQSPTVVND